MLLLSFCDTLGDVSSEYCGERTGANQRMRVDSVCFRDVSRANHRKPSKIVIFTEPAIVQH
jgi:hypothetical protein